VSALLGFAAWLAVAGSPAEPGPTPWAQAGARPWSLCRGHEREAQVRLESEGVQVDEAKSSVWRTRAALCPGSPAVLVAAALVELGRPPELLASPVELGRVFVQQREDALAWLRRARAESARRGEAPPPLTDYLEAYASYGLGELDRAAAALDAARARGDVESWRIDRLGALVALGRGDLDAAVHLAHRSWIHAATSGRVASAYVWALVMDRAGATDEARRDLARLRSSEARGRSVLDSLLPVHERFYVMALEQEALGHASGAIELWQAYLTLPAVQAAERVQVERRLAELGRGGLESAE